MNKRINEQISAFLDGELSQDELPLLLRQLDAHPDLLREAQSLQLTHLCLLGEQPVQAASQASQFCQNIHTAIAAEQPHQSMSLQSQATLTTAHTNSVGNRQLAANDGFWKKGMAGTGIAAAVALLAVNLWQSPSLNAPDSQVVPANYSAQNAEPTPITTPITTPVSDKPVESYTVPRYISSSESDGTTYFLDQLGDLQTVSLEQGLLFGPSTNQSLLSHQTMFIRMREAESHAQNLMQENLRLRKQLALQAETLRNLENQ